MFGEKKRKIQSLEQQLSAGAQQYDAALASIGELRTLLDRVGGGDLVVMQEVAAQMRREQAELQSSMERQRLEIAQRTASAEENLRILEGDARAVSDRIDDRKWELAQLDMHLSDTVVMVDNGLTNYMHPAESSLELSGRLSEVRSQIKEMIRGKMAIKARDNFIFNNSASQGRKFVADMSKMMLRAYNAEVENCVLTVKAGNGETARNRLERTRDQVERLGSLINLALRV